MPQSFKLICRAVFLLWLTAASSFAQSIKFQGGANYQYQGDRLYLKINKISNTAQTKSGTVKLDLWATKQPYSGGGIRGHRLGSIKLNPLKAGYSYENLVRQVAFSRPAAGSYYVTLTVSEYTKTGYLISDHLSFSRKAQFKSQQPTGKPLVIQGNTQFSWDKNGLRLQADRVVNRRYGGYSGSLLLRLWATGSKYSGGRLYGYQLGTVKLGQLDGGKSFSGIDQQVALNHPPAGRYYITMTLDEYRGDEYVTADFRTFSKPQTFKAKESYQKPIRFVGSGGYSIQGGQIEITSEKVVNENSGGNSGTLKLDVIATQTPYKGGSFYGYTLGSLRKGQLKAGFVFKDVRAKVPFQRPPAGDYYVSLMLREYRNNEFVTIDFRTFKNVLTVKPEKAAKKPLRFVGSGGYSWKDDRVTLNVDKIVNEASAGSSGTLKVELWGTTQPYQGGSIYGHRLGSFRKEGLAAGYVYRDVREQVDFRRPPPGTYNLALVLMEYDGEEYLIKDYIAFDKVKTFKAPKEKKDPVRFIGYARYKFDDDEVILGADKITNENSNGSTGSLEIRLWATKKKYKGGSIDGYILGKFDKDPLKAGYYYGEISKRVKAYKPPKGTYYLTMTLGELKGEKYTILDYIRFEKQRSY